LELDVVVEALLVADLQIVLAVEVGDPAVDVLFSVGVLRLPLRI